MKLGAKFARAVLAGSRPALTGEPDLEPGELIELKRFYVWIRPLKQDKDGIWDYSVRDDRPPPFRMTATGSLPSDELATIIHDQTVKREPEPERTNPVDEDRDRLSREVDVRNAYRQRQQRLREERMAAEASLRNATRRGSRSTIRTLKTKIETIDQRLRRAA